MGIRLTTFSTLLFFDLFIFNVTYAVIYQLSSIISITKKVYKYIEFN